MQHAAEVASDAAIAGNFQRAVKNTLCLIDVDLQRASNISMRQFQLMDKTF